MTKKVFKIIFNIATWILIIFLIIVAITSIISKSKGSIKAPVVLGYSVYQIVSGSMQPTIKVGDIVIVKITDYEDIKVNDIVTFVDDKASIIITHRAGEILEDGTIITWGDYTQSPDGELPKENLIGKVVLKLSILGQLMRFIQTPIGFMLIIALPIILLIITEIISAIRKTKTKQ